MMFGASGRLSQERCRKVLILVQVPEFPFGLPGPCPNSGVKKSLWAVTLQLMHALFIQVVVVLVVLLCSFWAVHVEHRQDVFTPVRRFRPAACEVTRPPMVRADFACRTQSQPLCQCVFHIFHILSPLRNLSQERNVCNCCCLAARCPPLFRPAVVTPLLLNFFGAGGWRGPILLANQKEEITGHRSWIRGVMRW